MSECSETLCTTTLRHHVHTDADGRSWCCGPHPYTAPAPSPAAEPPCPRCATPYPGACLRSACPRTSAAEPPDGLREAIAAWLFDVTAMNYAEWERLILADALLAGPLAPLLDRAAKAEAAVARVEALAGQMERWQSGDSFTTGDEPLTRMWVASLRRALDGAL